MQRRSRQLSHVHLHTMQEEKGSRGGRREKSQEKRLQRRHGPRRMQSMSPSRETKPRLRGTQRGLTGHTGQPKGRGILSHCRIGGGSTYDDDGGCGDGAAAAAATTTTAGLWQSESHKGNAHGAPTRDEYGFLSGLGHHESRMCCRLASKRAAKRGRKVVSLVSGISPSARHMASLPLNNTRSVQLAVTSSSPQQLFVQK